MNHNTLIIILEKDVVTIFYSANADEFNIIPIRGETFYSFEDFKEVSEYLKELLNVESFINFQIFLILSEDAQEEQSKMQKYFEAAEIFSLPMEVIKLYNDFLEKKEIADCNSSLKQIKNDYTRDLCITQICHIESVKANLLLSI